VPKPLVECRRAKGLQPEPGNYLVRRFLADRRTVKGLDLELVSGNYSAEQENSVEAGSAVLDSEEVGCLSVSQPELVVLSLEVEDSEAVE
jgi:hypothetical protein